MDLKCIFMSRKDVKPFEIDMPELRYITNHWSAFNCSGGFCTTIKMKSSSGATRTSCFLLLILKYVSSFAGSKSLTIDFALSESCDTNTEYYNKIIEI